MKKRISAALVVVMAVLCFTGCMYGEDRISVNEDGSGQSYSKITVDKALYDQAASSLGMTTEDLGLGEGKVQTIEGKEYYVFEVRNDFSSFGELKDGLENGGYSGIYVSENGLRYVLDSGVSKEDVKMMEDMGLELGNSMKVFVCITMPKEIVKTTGTLSEDKKTATFEIQGNDLYDVHDIMVSTKAENTRPTLSGIANNKTYGGPKTVTVKDASGISSARYKKNDGKYYSFDISKTFAKNGKYTVYAEDYYGNKAEKTFTIKDTTRPSVSGVINRKTYTKERKITFSDNCGVKSVKLYMGSKVKTLTPEEIENGIELSGTGSFKIVVNDINGNSRTVLFKLK
ncbi:MAG: hypothetical protein MRZ97_10285 [Firmicutes bacterium]|nr:hypothetical protein [Bacillota bacterium]